MVGITFAIYIMVGVEIFKKSSLLRSFSSGYSSNSAASDSVLLSKTRDASAITEVEVTSSPASFPGAPGPSLSVDRGNDKRGFSGGTECAPYTITIESKEKGLSSATRSGPKMSKQSQSGGEWNAAARGYARCAFLFFLAMLITWVGAFLRPRSREVCLLIKVFHVLRSHLAQDESGILHSQITSISH